MSDQNKAVVQRLIDALNADLASRRRYQDLYDTLLNASAYGSTLAQAEMQEQTGIPQAIISQMLKRLINCGVVRILPVKVNGLNQYTVIDYDRIDYERVVMACEIFEMQVRVKALRETYAQRYEPIAY